MIILHQSRLSDDRIALWAIISVLIVILCGMVFLYLYYVRKTAYIKKILYIDHVTQGVNTLKFTEDVPKILKDEENRYLVGVLNIKDFRYVNDYYGIENGDKVLKFVHDKICSVIEKGECCRAFNDTFMFITRYDDRDNILFVIKMYLLNYNINLDGRDVYLKCDCGVFFVEDRYLSVTKLFDNAMLAMKSLSTSQSGGIGVYDVESDRKFANNKKYIMNMREAMNNGEFKTFVQPKINPVTGKCVGGEALVRWISNKHGLIKPGEFIPLFEKNGFVVDIDWCVLKTVKAFQIERLRSKKRTVKLSVNQSRIHLNNPYYINEIETMIGDDIEVKPFIEFEITESTFLDRCEEALDLINKLTKMGFTVSIDDFGSGYSSLSMLKDINFSVLKIDQGFVKTNETMERNAMILKSIIELTHNLGSEVVCEGVENKDQVELLKGFGCDMIQGYYYGKPMSIETFGEYLDKNMDEA